ncbi:MAG: DUF5399 domain-containing protein [Chlamydiia bacterium]|nr:DUF5399 domain-containing protein [Chlamydiia bacterium]
MATIDQLDISVYNQYAIRTRAIEQINAQLRLDQADSIPPQLQMVDLYPKLTEIDLLLGVVPMSTPWAFFFPPKSFRTTRRSPFAFHRVIPSMGSLKDQEEEYEHLADTPTQTKEEAEEKAVLTKAFNQMDKINDMLSFIIGRVGQFLQG